MNPWDNDPVDQPLRVEINGTAADEPTEPWNADPVDAGPDVRAGTLPAVDSDPDKVAQARALSQATGIPASIIEEDPAPAERRVKLQKLDEAAAADPAVAKVLADPETAKLAHDDVENLSLVGETVRSFGRFFGAIGAAVPQVNAGLWGVIRAGADIVGAESVAGYAAERAGEQSGFVEDLRPKSGNWVQDAAYSGVTSFAQSLMFAPAGVAGLLSSFGLTSGGEAYSQARDAGKGVGESLAFGASQGVIEAGTEMLPAKYFLDLMKGGAGKGLLGTVKQFAASEGIGEQVATLLQDLNEWAVLNPEKSLREFAAERPGRAAETLIATVVSVGASTTAAQAVQAYSERAQAAQQAAQQAEQLLKASEASQLRARDPEAFRNFLRDASTDEAGDESTFFIDGRAFAQAIGSTGVSFEEFRAKAPELAQQMIEAVQTGGDVEIPVADFATAFAGTQEGATLLQHVRTSPDAASAAEAAVFAQTQPEVLQQEIERATAEAVGEEVGQRSETTVRDRILQQLQSTGRYNGEVAGINAQVAASMFTALGAKMGRTAEQVMADFPLRIVGENPAAPGEVLRATDDPQFRAWFGNSKAVEQTGGTSSRDAKFSPQRMYHTTRKSFDKFEVGRPATNSTTFGDVETTRNAIFVTPDAGASAAYGTQGGAAAEGANTMPLYVKAENPLDLTSGLTEQDEARLLAAGLDSRFIHNRLGHWEVFDGEEGKALVETLKAAGYDSVIFNDENPDTGDAFESWAVFDPAQIKSVFNRGTWDANDPNILNQTTSLRSGRETLARFGLKPGVKHKTRQVAAALEARQRRKYGVIEAGDHSPEALRKIAAWMVEEVEFEMQHPENSGLGWYSEKFQRALDIMAEEFPELRTDKAARDTMTLLIAITSDGQKVVPNFAQAMDIYSNFRQSGQFTTSRGHARQASIDNNLRIIQELYAKWSPQEVHAYLMQEKKVGDLKRLAAEHGAEFNTQYQVHIKLPMAAVVLGPKLGAFYANLMGAHGYLTMDRWWSRTFNRYRGTLLQAPTREGLDRFKTLLGDESLSDDETIAATVEHRNRYEAKGFKDGTEIEKAANTIYKAAFEALEDAPFNATDRTFMLDAVKRAAATLKRRGTPLSIADIQAILWYYEKRLYGELGARQTADISYEEAAQRVVEQRALGTPVQGAAAGAEGDTGADDAGVRVGEELFDEGRPAVQPGPEPGFPVDLADRTAADVGGVVLNVGLADPAGGPPLTEEQVTKAIEGFGVRVVRSKRYQSNTEPTLVARLSRELTPAEAHELSEALGQEAVVQMVGHRGALHGPKKENWGEFNPDFFITLDGKPASQIAGATFAQSVPTPTVGYHYSNGPRTLLDGRHYGTVGAGEERARVARSDDPRIKSRVYAYIDWGKGITPEGMVGGFAHEIALPALYDFDADPLRLRVAGDANATESAILDAGFGGYFVREFGEGQGAAVILGEASHEIPARPATPARGVAAATRQAPTKYRTPLMSKEIDAIDMADVQAAAPSAKLSAGTFSVDVGDLSAAREVLSKFGVALPETSLNQESISFLGFGGAENNASGESAASLEAQSRVESERRQSRTRVVVDKTGNVRPLIGVDAVDQRAYPGQVILQRGVGRDEWTVLDAGEGVTEGDRARAIARVKSEAVFNQTNSAAFKKWFGESKVVDKNGAPLRVFHASLEDFAAFDKGAIRADDLDAPFNGFWFSTDAWESARQGATQAKVVYPVYLSLQNPAPAREWRKAARDAEQDLDRLMALGARSAGDATRMLLQERGFDGVVWDEVPSIDTAELDATGETVFRGPRGNGYRLVREDGGVDLYGFSYRDENGKAVYDEFITGYESVEDFLSQQEGIYVVFEPTQIKSVFNDGTFDPVDPSILGQRQEAPRGTFNPSTLTISLLEKADLSTFLHELGHFGLEMMVEIAAQPGAPQSVIDDVRIILDWFGVKDIQTWRAMTMDEQRPYHEQFAEGFETYLFEGKSPSADLNSAFARVAAWMLNVYKSLTSMRVKLTPEVRGVFDRMLATNDQIAEQSRLRSMAPMFESAEQAGMSAKDWAAYQEIGAQAARDAVADLRSRTLRDMRWLSNAKGRALKKLQDSAKEARRGVRAEVEAQVDAQPVYAAMAFIEHGALAERDLTNAQRKALDTLAGGKTKLSLPALKELYGTDPAAPWRYIKQTMVAAEDGAHPDAIAEAFGFDSGDALVRAILAAEPRQQLVEALTDKRMLEEHADLSDPVQIELAAEAAIHNEARIRFVATEMKALQDGISAREKVGETKVSKGKQAGQTRAITVDGLVRAASQYAEAIVGRTVVRRLSPTKHARAAANEAKAASEAMKKGDLQEALAHKRNQLLHEKTSRAMSEAITEFEKNLGYLRKFRNSNRARGAIDADYVEQIENLLNAVDTRQASNKRLESLASLRKWIAAQEAEGLPVALDAELIESLQITNVRDLTVEQLRALVDQVRSIEHLGKLKKKLLTARDKREFDAIADELAASIREHGGKPRDVPFAPGAAEHTGRRLWDGFFAEHRKLASLAREMDGVVDDGPMWRALIRSMNDAGNRETARIADSTKVLGAIFKPLTKLKGGLTGDKRLIPSLGQSLSRGERMAVLLNWGNEHGRQRVLNTVPAPAVAEIMQTMSREEALAIQAVWDHVNEYWPDIAAKEKRVTGTVPEKVDALPFTLTLADGGTVEMRGGYYPIVYESEMSDVAAAHEQAQIAKEMQAGAYTRATTRRGHTKKRAEKVGEPLRFTLDVIERHISQVVHDLAWHEWLIDAGRLLRDKRISSAIRDHYGPATLKAMKDALSDIATGDLQRMSRVEALVSTGRARVSAAMMGWSATTALLQPFGLFQSIPRVGAIWIARGMKHWAGDTLRLENSARIIREKSAMMRHRSTTFNRDIREVTNRIHRGKGVVSEVFDASLFVAMQKMQLIADIPTWWGAYEKAMAESTDEGRAVALADQAVLDAQGGGQVKDLAGVQRGNELKRALSMFYSYFSATWNLAAESTARTNFRKPAQVAGWLADMVVLSVVPVLAQQIVFALVRGGDDDEDKDWAERAMELSKALGSFWLNTLIGVREFSGMVQGFEYNGPAATRALVEAGNLGKTVKKAVDPDEELDDADYRRATKSVLTLLGWPAAQIDRSWRGWQAYEDGEAGPGGVILGPPPKD